MRVLEAWNEGKEAEKTLKRKALQGEGDGEGRRESSEVADGGGGGRRSDFIGTVYEIN